VVTVEGRQRQSVGDRLHLGVLFAVFSFVVMGQSSMSGYEKKNKIFAFSCDL
jgi:hypothetical protein